MIGKDNYFDWILTKSQTKTLNGKVVALDLSWLGIRYLPENFLSGLNHLIELRFDNNPKCVYEDHCFGGVPKLIGIKLKYCGFKEFPINSFSNDSPIQTLQISNNSIKKINSDPFINLQRLEMIDFSNCQIQEISPNIFANLQKLRAIYLNNNFLTFLPQFTFTNLHNLRNLDLQYNYIQTIYPGSFADLSRLENLSLSHNHIEELPEGIFSTTINLKNISLDHNQIQKIDRQFMNLFNLTNLNLDANSIHEISENAFMKSKNLLTLDLRYNNLKFIPSKVFESLDRLEYLNLRDNPLEIETALKIPSAANFDFSGLIIDIDPQTLHEYIVSYPQNHSFINQAIYSGKLLEKTWAFLRIIGFDIL